ncbi:MAG: 4a-hydroxytetrahydrobiopterin dehydratase [Deltaproteobacteria bacterium]|nr:4a-hydroxytetrahydrobiopterin dehydratase [Deltaproteobacteria bacterium]
MALSQAEIQGKLRALPGWELIKNKGMQKKFTLGTFKDALAFVNKVGELAEQSDHHPDITINYNKVTLSLISHDVGALTTRDFDLAGHIEKIEKA